ncbi:MAG: hypothetical protein HPY69_10250 [Armatimonadetes bacterium]|nr:hypothetical protein [Armatimonadota bacterium]
MPTYEYNCTKCGHTFEVRQSFSEAPVTKCVSCSGKVRKVFSPPAIIFKGKGFHCTDYSKSGAPKANGTCSTCPKDAGSGETCSSDAKSKCAAT